MHFEPKRVFFPLMAYLSAPHIALVTMLLLFGVAAASDRSSHSVGGAAGGRTPQRRHLAASGALFFEAESLARTSTQHVSTSAYKLPSCSAGACIKLNSNAPGQYLELTLPDVPPGTYDITIRYRSGDIRGACQVSADGAPQLALDQYQPAAAASSGNVAVVGRQVDLAGGDVALRLTVTGQNPRSHGYSLGIDTVELFPSGGTEPEWGDVGNGTYVNPILWADYNNLDVLFANGYFYMVAASHFLMGMPVLRSPDGINWQLICRIYTSLDISPEYDTPGLAYAAGSRAPSLSRHGGLFYVHVANPAQLFVFTAADPEGPWSPPTLMTAANLNHIDPAPFWDSVPGQGGDGPDGERAYLFMKNEGRDSIDIYPMSWDGLSVLSTSFTTIWTYTVIEGPKVLQKDGYYYVFCPLDGMFGFRQAVLRAESVLGPYSLRVVFDKGAASPYGGHQGSFVELPSGEAWFFHFDFRNPWGRLADLQPAGWGADGWPTIGVGVNAAGCGFPVQGAFRKPAVAGGPYAIQTPLTSDDFEDPALGLQWLWNHNPNNSLWSLAARPGYLRLNATALAGAALNVLYAYNTVVQEVTGQVAAAVARVDVGGMADGGRGGLLLFGQTSLMVGVAQDGGARRFAQWLSTGLLSPPSTVDGPSLEEGQTEVYLKGAVSAGGECSVLYSTDGVSFMQLGPAVTPVYGLDEGTKVGLFSFSAAAAAPDAGAIDVASFTVTSDGPVPM